MYSAMEADNRVLYPSPRAAWPPWNTALGVSRVTDPPRCLFSANFAASNALPLLEGSRHGAPEQPAWGAGVSPQCRAFETHPHSGSGPPTIPPCGPMALCPLDAPRLVCLLGQSHPGCFRFWEVMENGTLCKSVDMLLCEHIFQST